jgi:hypothetical protein
VNDNEWLQFCIDEARNFGHADKAAALERIAAALNAQAGVVEALEDCIDSLEYVNRTHPESSGWGVRSERISKARDALAAIKGVES